MDSYYACVEVYHRRTREKLMNSTRGAETREEAERWAAASRGHYERQGYDVKTLVGTPEEILGLDQPSEVVPSFPVGGAR